jgi:YidC/Oxa1 family membrane protein insertase
MEGRLNQEQRLVVAVVLMIAVLIGTNLLFAPAAPPPPAEESTETVVEEAPAPPPVATDPVTADTVGAVDPVLPLLDPQEDPPAIPTDELAGAEAEPAPERFVSVESPLYRMTFSTRGARLTEAQLLKFESFTEDGPAQLVADAGFGILGTRLVTGADTVDLRRVAFEVEPAEGLRLEEGDEGASLAFVYQHPTEPFAFEIRYHFEPENYAFRVSGRVRGLERALILTDLGRGIAFNDADQVMEERETSYVANHIQNGIRSEPLSKVDRNRLDEGPFHWAAVKSRYFVVGILPAIEPGGTEFFGGVLARPVVRDDEVETAEITVTHSARTGGVFDFRVFAGPQDYQLLSLAAADFQEVNPVGWRFIRPILRPFVGVIMWVLVFMHENLEVGYGWVLIIFGIMMRVLLFPLNHKAMRAQLRNLAVQPLLKDIQTKYKDQPEKMQKELMKLYKEHGFNPLAGCWPMLLPWPVLIALFFVFQNTIELRGVPFAWLPDLAMKDPLFVLPVLLGISMFLMQWISFRTMEEINPQMKMMMWLLPIFMVVIFANLPSGLNLYYLTANLATLPQSWWIANERKKVQAKGPPTMEPAEA